MNEKQQTLEFEDMPKEIIGDLNSVKKNNIDMNKIIGSHDILFVCLDTLRYDIAIQEEQNNNTPILNKYGKWQKCHAPGNFTYPSHMAMFAGFLPSPAKFEPMLQREMLFFPKGIGAGMTRSGSFAFEGATFIEGLAKENYKTICIGGVAFFDKRSDIGKVLPSYFQESYWQPSFRCGVEKSATNQINFAVNKLNTIAKDQRVFMYINIDAIHYPNYFYVDGATKDSLETHAAALRYVDTELEKLFTAFKNRNETFVITCSDHGTCYGEDGYYFHCISHENVYTVPYKHFVL